MGSALLRSSLTALFARDIAEGAMLRELAANDVHLAERLPSTFGCLAYAYNCRWDQRGIMAVPLGALSEFSEEGQPGDIVWYFDRVPTHFGVLEEGGCVRSKWGVGHAYRHSLFSVPSQYGENVKYASAPSAALLRNAEQLCRDFMHNRKSFNAYRDTLFESLRL